MKVKIGFRLVNLSFLSRGNSDANFESLKRSLIKSCFLSMLGVGLKSYLFVRNSEMERWISG